MPLFNFLSGHIEPISAKTFKEAGLKERSDIQRLLRNHIEVIAKDTMVIGEEFCDWEDSNRRIDLLALDKNANLVIIELKRDDSAHMELQALRYAAMVSTMTWRKAVDIYADHLRRMGKEEQSESAESVLLEYLDWDEPYESQFAQDVRIILASSAFSKELTTTVMWLNDKYRLDIRCVRMTPYVLGDQTLVDVQQLIPLQEASEFQTRLREKTALEATDRKQNRDMTRYEVEIDGKVYPNLPKRRAVFEVVRQIIETGASPEKISSILTWNPWFVLEGNLDSARFTAKAIERLENEGRSIKQGLRVFNDEQDLIHVDENTYAFTTQWGEPWFSRAMAGLTNAFPNSFTYRAAK